jgi:DNA-binding MarR family transcriptional regulator
MRKGGDSARSGWTFLTPHSLVLIHLARDPQATQHAIALAVGVTSRHVARLVDDLSDAGYITRERIGRRNRYRINLTRQIREEAAGGCNVGDLVSAFVDLETRPCSEKRTDG